MNIIKDKKDITINVANRKCASFSDFQNQIKKGKFYKLEVEFIGRISKITSVERKELKYALKNEIFDCDFKTSYWLTIAFPCYIAITAIFGSVYIAINSLVEDITGQSILLTVAGLITGVLVIFSMMTVAKKHLRNKEFEKFCRFYYDIC
ncbi:hypothetical protein PMSD_20690 [Paenibacillus macquariensis subsp. defensor]|nr:hypothetical protein PMSD_20690 [Paenibacillus macquariensis subsp. defensor]